MNSISIIMPAFNSEDQIVFSIESVLSQSFRHWELIIVDDGSTDNTRAVVYKYCLLDKRIKYFYISNQKQAIARNYGIKIASYDYLAFLDSDDVWHPSKLEIFVSAAKKMPYVDLFFSNSNIVKRHKVRDNIDSFRNAAGSEFTVIADELKLASIVYANYIPLSTVVLKKTEFIFFDSDFVPAEDFELWLRLIKERNICICYTNDALTDYLDNPSSSTSKDRLVVNKVLRAISNHFTADEINHLGLRNRIDQFLSIWLKKQLLTGFTDEFWMYFSSNNIHKKPIFFLSFKYFIRIFEKIGLGYYGKKVILNFYGVSCK